jgi:hypothetical protein
MPVLVEGKERFACAHNTSDRRSAGRCVPLTADLANRVDISGMRMHALTKSHH